MAVDLPPGILWAVQNLPYIVAPPVITYHVLKVSLGFLGLPDVSSWILAVATLLLMPATTALRILYRDYNVRKEARTYGAELPPLYRNSSFAGLALIKLLAGELVSGYIGDVFNSMTEVCGANTILFKPLFEYRVFTSDPDTIKALLASQFTSFEKGYISRGLNQRLLGSGIFNADGDIWKFHRGISRPFFSKERIAHFDNFERHFQEALRLAKERLTEGIPIDIQDLTSRFTMDSATEYLFDRDVASLSAGLAYPPSHPLHGSMDNHPANVFANAFVQAQHLTAMRGRRGKNWALWELWEDEVKPYRKILDGYVDPIIKQALERKSVLGGEKGEKAEAEESDSMLEYLVGQTDDINLIRDTVLNMLIAGRDTTGCTLTFAIYMLAEHPDVLAKLREEILSKIGSDRTPTFEDMRDLKYLRAVINETLRLYPPVPVNARQTILPTVIPAKNSGDKPVFIPAGTRTFYSVLLMHRRQDLWGPDAHEFDPERWIDERLRKYFTPNPFIFTPFNAGPRICLGQQFAYHETSYFLIRFLQRYHKITSLPEVQDASARPPSIWKGVPGPKGRDTVWPRTHLTMYSKGGCWVKLEEASSSE